MHGTTCSDILEAPNAVGTVGFAPETPLAGEANNGQMIFQLGNTAPVFHSLRDNLESVFHQFYFFGLETPSF